MVVTVTSTVTYLVGGFHYMFSNDSTFITPAIFGVFYLASMWCGVSTWRLSHALSKNSLDKELFYAIERQDQTGGLISSIEMGLGMLGTLVGLLMATNNFGSLSNTDIANIQKLLSDLGGGSAVALITTIAGLICSILLNIQHFNLNLELQKSHKSEWDK